MAEAWWETLPGDEVSLPNTDLYLQKGTYHFYDKSRPPEVGYRFIWRVNGKLQSRPARIDDLSTIAKLVTLGLARGWT